MILDRFSQGQFDSQEVKERGICEVCGEEIYNSFLLTPDGYMLHPFCAGEWGRQQFEQTSAFGEMCPVCQMPILEYEESLENVEGEIVHYECVDKWAEERLIYMDEFLEDMP